MNFDTTDIFIGGSLIAQQIVLFLAQHREQFVLFLEQVREQLFSMLCKLENNCSLSCARKRTITFFLFLEIMPRFSNIGAPLTLGNKVPLFVDSEKCPPAHYRAFEPMKTKVRMVQVQVPGTSGDWTRFRNWKVPSVCSVRGCKICRDPSTNVL